MIWLATGTVLLAATAAVMASALVEVYRQLAEIRVALRLDDLPMPLALGRGELTASAIGLPHELAIAPEAIAVFLTTTCATCLMVAEMFRGGSPGTVWFVVPQSDSDLATALEASSDRIVLDPDGAIAERAGLNVAPSVLTIRYGDVVRAQAVSSPRQVMSLVPAVTPRGSPLTEKVVLREPGQASADRLAV